MRIEDMRIGMKLKIKDELPENHRTSTLGYTSVMDEYWGKVSTVSAISEYMGGRPAFVKLRGFEDSFNSQYTWELDWVEEVIEMAEIPSDNINIYNIHYKE